MEEKKTTTNNSKALSYDELKNAATYWAQQAKFYKEKAEEFNAELQKVNLYNDFKRIDYLFKVLETSQYFEMEFLNACATEIQEFLTPVTESDNKTE